jgi:hypothetical protein
MQILVFISKDNIFTGKFPEYAHIKFSSIFSVAHCTKIKPKKLRVKEELKFWYIKKNV